MEQEDNYLGKEVYKIDHEGYAKESRLISLFDIAAGSDIMVPVGDGFNKMKVSGDGVAFVAQDEENITFLEFDKDDRHCWCCVAVLKKEELAKGKLVPASEEKRDTDVEE